MLSPAMTVDTAPVEAVENDGDHALVRAAGLGDARAFEQLYRRHARRVHAVVWRLAGGQTARAEDLVQEAFIRAWQALPAFRYESAFSTWLHRLAVNTASSAQVREAIHQRGIAAWRRYEPWLGPLAERLGDAGAG